MLKNSYNLNTDNSRIIFFVDVWVYSWYIYKIVINNSKYYQLIWIFIGNDSCNAIIRVLLSIGKFSHLIVPLFYSEYNLRTNPLQHECLVNKKEFKRQSHYNTHCEQNWWVRNLDILEQRIKCVPREYGCRIEIIWILCGSSNKDEI